MTYISFRGVRVKRRNAKWSLGAFIAGFVTLVVALVATPSDFASLAFLAAHAFLMAGIIVAVPGIVVPLALLLAPFGVAVYGATHDWEVWRTLWFWVAAVVCEGLGGFALVWFGRKYGKRMS